MNDDNELNYLTRPPGECPMPEGYDAVVEELTMMLIYLTSWLEKPYPVRRAWKGYEFDVLNELAVKELISDSKKSKLVYLTEKGEKKGQELLRKHGMLK